MIHSFNADLTVGFLITSAFIYSGSELLYWFISLIFLAPSVNLCKTVDFDMLKWGVKSFNEWLYLGFLKHSVYFIVIWCLIGDIEFSYHTHFNAVLWLQLWLLYLRPFVKHIHLVKKITLKSFFLLFIPRSDKWDDIFFSLEHCVKLHIAEKVWPVSG